jgi:hypothetical protein
LSWAINRVSVEKLPKPSNCALEKKPIPEKQQRRRRDFGFMILVK